MPDAEQLSFPLLSTGFLVLLNMLIGYGYQSSVNRLLQTQYEIIFTDPEVKVCPVHSDRDRLLSFTVSIGHYGHSLTTRWRSHGVQIDTEIDLEIVRVETRIGESFDDPVVFSLWAYNYFKSIIQGSSFIGP